jgi:hypothetical protein
MRNPDVYTAQEIQNWDASTNTKDGNWIPARPLPFYGWRLFHNIKLALAVLIGKYDALDWEEDK